jgi:uncharacterized protein
MKYRNTEFVIKTSKKCNLRCQYCYEFGDLHKPDAMSLEQVEAMYKNIAKYYQDIQIPVSIGFIWHGGEPLLISTDFYWKALDLQTKIFDHKDFKIRNSVQTNLTVLDNERLKLLLEGFETVGVSIDVFGDLRTYENGHDSQSRVLENMDKLQDHKIPFGCITVLNKSNINNIKQIYKFYRELNLKARLLPLHQVDAEDQHNGIEIDSYSVLEAFKTIFDLWMEDEKFIWITPVIEMVQEVLRFYTPSAECSFYDKREWEALNIVNTNGDVYGYADAYVVGRSYGNIFTTSLHELYGSHKHEESILSAESRLNQTCISCKFFGACSGYSIAEDGYEYHELDEHGGIRCIVHKGMLQYIEYRLIEEGVIVDGTLDLQQMKSIASDHSEIQYA